MRSVFRLITDLLPLEMEELLFDVDDEEEEDEERLPLPEDDLDFSINYKLYL